MAMIGNGAQAEFQAISVKCVVGIGDAEGRGDRRQITFFDSMGFAIKDFSALRYIHNKIIDSELVEQIDMLVYPDDLHDLFGILQRAA